MSPGGKRGGLWESHMCFPDILSIPLHFLASIVVKQGQVAAVGQWTESRSGAYFQAKVV